MDTNTDNIKRPWEEELNVQIDDDTWSKAFDGIRSCSVNPRIQLIQYKVVHRLHYSKVKLHTIFSDSSPLWLKGAHGTLTHLFWSCPNLHNFWSTIFQWYSAVFNVNLSPDPETALFGYSNALECLGTDARTALVNGMMIAKRYILKLWKSDFVPRFKTWLGELTGMLHVEKLRYDLSGNPQKFLKIWSPVLLRLRMWWTFTAHRYTPLSWQRYS